MASFAVRGLGHPSTCGGSAFDSGQSGYALALTQSDTPIQVLPPTNNGHAPTCPEERSRWRERLPPERRYAVSARSPGLKPS